MVLNEAAARLGVSLRKTEDELTRNMLAGTAAQLNCVGGGNGDLPTNISFEDISAVVQALASNDAYTITDLIEGEDRFGSAPIPDSYFALASTKMISDLNNLGEFVPKCQYPSPAKALRSEWGSCGNLRFLLSSQGSVSTAASFAGDDVYNIFCVGMEAYACIEQDGYSASFLYRPPIYSGPMELNCSCAYKFAEVPRITNDLWVINLRATLA